MGLLISLLLHPGHTRIEKEHKKIRNVLKGKSTLKLVFFIVHPFLSFNGSHRPSWAPERKRAWEESVELASILSSCRIHKHKSPSLSSLLI